MNVYDKAHELAACLKQSDEYREYQRLRIELLILGRYPQPRFDIQRPPLRT